MITPDGSDPGNDAAPKRSRAVLLGLASILVFAGLAAMGALTTPDPQPETTTTVALAINTTTTDTPETIIDFEQFSVSDIAQGEPFTWEEVMTVDSVYPLDLIDHEGHVYLFVTEELPFNNQDEGGLRAWRTGDGNTWEALGQVIGREHAITAVSSTGQGLVALEPGQAGSGFTVWRSGDGSDWHPEEVTVDGLNEFETFTPRAVGGTADLLLVAGRTGLDTIGLVDQRIDDRLRDHISEYGAGLDIATDTFEVTAFLPGGLPVAGITAEDLGLSEEEQQLAIEAYEGESQIWTSSDEGWMQTGLPEGRGGIDSVIGTPWGEILVFGFGTSGPDGWVTSNGVDWEETTPGDLFGGEIWGNGIVSTSFGPQPSMSVLGSDGVWAEIGPGGLFPHVFSWDVGALAAGPGGAAALATVWARPGEPPEPPTLTNQDGAALTADFGAGTFILDGVHTWHISEELPPGVEVDLETGTVSFHQPGNGELLATFDLQAIDEAHRSWLRQNYWPDRHRAFIFTPTGSEWTIQDVAQFGDAGVLSFEVTDTRVIAVATARPPFVDPGRQTPIQVWSAEIP